MLKKQLLLTLLSVALLAGFFFLPENRTWAKRLIGYSKEIPAQAKKLDRTSRLAERFGTGYTYSVFIADKITKNNEHDELLLMPPTNYFTKTGLKYHVPEPAVFYYFTGIKTVWADSKEAINAKWYVHVKDGKFVLTKASNKAALQDTISVFKKYGVTL